MRLMTWNLNHRTRAKEIPPHLIAQIASLEPDLAVLTEYVHGEFREPFLAQLADRGLPYWYVSRVTPPRENHVLIACRTPLERGSIEAPTIAPSVPSNALHVIVPHEGIEVLGLRVPDYSKELTIKRACWNWILETAKTVRDRPFVLLGDFNTDPRYPKRLCGDCIESLIDDGWQIASPADDASASYRSFKNGCPCRIDHAFVSGHFTILGSKYVSESEGRGFIGIGPEALSDHAILAIDIELNVKPGGL